MHLIGDDVAFKVDTRRAALRTRRYGGKAHVHAPGHPLDRGDGWVVAARWVLHERWLCEGVTAPRCETPGCGPRGGGYRVAWSPRRTVRVGGVRAAIPWFLDGNSENLGCRNVIGVCASCSARAHATGRARTIRGRFATET